MRRQRGRKRSKSVQTGGPNKSSISRENIPEAKPANAYKAREVTAFDVLARRESDG